MTFQEILDRVFLKLDTSTDIDGDLYDDVYASLKDVYDEVVTEVRPDELLTSASYTIPAGVGIVPVGTGGFAITDFEKEHALFIDAAEDPWINRDYRTWLRADDMRYPLWTFHNNNIIIKLDDKPAPSVKPTVAVGAAGNLDGAAYKWVYTFYDSVSGWEGTPSPISSSLALSSEKGELSALETAPLEITTTGEEVDKRRIYRTIGAGTGSFLLVEEISLVGTTYTDNTADGSLGATAPAAGETKKAVLHYYKTPDTIVVGNSPEMPREGHQTLVWGVLTKFPHLFQGDKNVLLLKYEKDYVLGKAQLKRTRAGSQQLRSLHPKAHQAATGEITFAGT